MGNQEVSLPDPETVDPERLTVLLSEAGWKLVGGRTGLYNRFSPPGTSASTIVGALVVPLDTSAPEYPDQMIGALREVSAPPHRDTWTRSIAPRLSANIADRFDFRKESAAPSGLIAWPSGEELIVSARRSLLAGAKAHLETARHFGNRLGQFANRYLESLLMGQTSPGSYVITAYAPTEAAIPIKGGPQDSFALEGLTVATGRRINQTVVNAFGAVTEAVDHYRQTGSFSAFDAGIDRGISFEMTRALMGITQNSDGADITVTWDPILPAPSQQSEIRFEFKGSDAEVFETASSRLIAPEAPRPVSVVGRVHLLTKKQAGGPGVVGVETFGGVGPRKLRVRMESSGDYNRAVQAHGQDHAVRVSGTLSREGNLNWLYNARLEDVLGSIEEFMGWDEPDPPVYSLPEEEAIMFISGIAEVEIENRLDE